jgi:hypothetical protein
MNKLPVIIVAIFATISVSAQRVPDEDDIIAATLSSASPYYYPAMMLRYLVGDMELTEEHYYYLYYGYAYDSSYDAHSSLPGEDVIMEIMATHPNPSQEEARTIIAAAKENMLVDPFNPGNINMMTYAYNVLGDTINEIISADRFRKVIGAITSSGTGEKENSPWHILRFSHANDLIAIKGFQIENRQVRSRSVEYVQVEKNRENIKGYFFDYSRVYWNPYSGERVRRKSKWELNGIPL